MRQRMIERRSCERYRTHLPGRVVCRFNRSSVPCIVLDLSAAGARLAFPEPAEIPLEFDLLIPEPEASAAARLVWSDGRDFGVRFTD